MFFNKIPKQFQGILKGLLICALILSVWMIVNLLDRSPKSLSWLFQLQKMEIVPLANSGFELSVIDYSRDGSESKKWSREDVHKLIDSNIIPIAYLSIGEAENYRYYWDKTWVRKNEKLLRPTAPDWLGAINPNWAGNHKVRYWSPEWRKNIIQPYLDRILAQEFKGVYLDIIDGFEYWADPKSYGEGKEQAHPDDPINDEAEAAARMIELVKWIAHYGRSRSPWGEEFMVFPQNGERILLYDKDGSYLETVTGIGVEDTWYYRDESLPDATADQRVKILKKFLNKGKQVLSVDYVDEGNYNSQANIDRIKRYFSKCRSAGFSCYAARTSGELKTINRIQGVQPYKS